MGTRKTAVDSAEGQRIIKLRAGLECKGPRPLEKTRKPSWPFPSHPSCFESSSFRWSVFWVAAPLCRNGRFLGRRPSFVPPLPGAGVPTDPQSPEGGSQRCRITRGGPTPRFLGHVSLITQSPLRNGGVGDAVDPADSEATLCNLSSRLLIRAGRVTVPRDRGLLPESSRTRGARWATVLAIEGSCRRETRIADSSALSAGRCNFATFATSSFGKR